MAVLAIAITMTSCEQAEVIDPIIEHTALQEPAHNYTALEATETYQLMGSETEGLDVRNSCYSYSEYLYNFYGNIHANNPTNYNLYMMNHHYITYLINYVNCCTEPECGEILNLAYSAYLSQHESDAANTPPCDYDGFILGLYNDLHAICSC